MTTTGRQDDARGRPLGPSRRDLLVCVLAAGMLGGVALATPRAGVAQGSGGPGVRDGEPEQRFMRIGTGSTAGYYFPIGGLIANAISRPAGSRPCERGGSCGVPGLIAVAQSTGGSVDNVAGLANRTLDLALCQADIAYWARTGTAVYESAGPMPGLVALARLYNEKAHLVVRADSPLTRIEDLRGARVAVGARGSGTLVDARLLLLAHGLDDGDVEAVHDQPGPAADLLVAGEIDAFFFIGAAPVTVVKELAETTPVRLLPLNGPDITAMIGRHPYMTAGIIPGGVYAGISAPVSTVSVGAVLVTTEEALDNDTAHAITRALWHPNTRPLLLAVATDAMMMTPAAAPHGTGIPLHPGAQRFYEEAGYLP